MIEKEGRFAVHKVIRVSPILDLILNMINFPMTTILPPNTNTVDSGT